MRTVPDIAAVEIERLRADGVTVTDDDIVWLASLGRRVECPGGATPEAAGLRHGIRLSDGTLLHPQTVGASMWLEKFGRAFRGEQSLYAVAYAMACPRALDCTAPMQTAVDAVDAWKRGLHVAVKELAAAVGRLLDTDAPRMPADADAPVQDTEAMLGRLVAITGLSYEYWERQTWARVAAADSGALRWARMVSAVPGDPAADESREALRDLLRALTEIRGREAGANG